MQKWMLSVVAILMVACVSPQQVGPEILPVFGQDVTEVAKPEYLVRINFVLFEDETLQYPSLYAAFQEAIVEWSKRLPIEAGIFVEKRVGIQFPFPIPIPIETISDQPGIVHVRLVNVQNPPYNMADSILGFWRWDSNELCLDADFLEINKSLALGVAMHELGHVFGLPHFVEEKNPDAITGSIVVSDAIDAKTLLMYPYLSMSNKDAKLSDLEINIALANVLDLDNLTRNDCLHLTSR